MTEKISYSIISRFSAWLPFIIVVVFALANILLEQPNPYDMPPAFGWLQNQDASSAGAHCSLSISHD